LTTWRIQEHQQRRKRTDTSPADVRHAVERLREALDAVVDELARLRIEGKADDPNRTFRLNNEKHRPHPDSLSHHG